MCAEAKMMEVRFTEKTSPQVEQVMIFSVAEPPFDLTAEQRPSQAHPNQPIFLSVAMTEAAGVLRSQSGYISGSSRKDYGPLDFTGDVFCLKVVFEQHLVC